MSEAPSIVRRSLAVALLAVLAGSCSGPQSPPVSLPPSVPTTHVAMREYRFDFTPPVHRGRAVFRFRNRGTLPHQISLLAVPSDMEGTIDDQLRGSTRRPLVPVFASLARDPGGEIMFASDLAPGRYAIICIVPDTDGVAHSLKGMTAEFRVS